MKKIVINDIEYFPVPLGIKRSGIVENCIVFTATPNVLQEMLDTTAKTMAEEMAEEKLNQLISKKVKQFLTLP
jgi:hypothetical protein